MRLKNFVYSLGFALLIAGILAAFVFTYSTASAHALKTSTTANVSQKSSSSVVVAVGQVPSQQAVGSTLSCTFEVDSWLSRTIK